MTTAQPLGLQQIEPGDDPLADQILDILRPFLQHDSDLSIEATSQRITALLPEGRPYSNEVARFLMACYEIAQQIPYSHPSATKLVAVVKSCLNSSRFDKSDRRVGRGERVQRLFETLHEWELSCGPQPDGTPTAYVNFQYFLYLLTKTGLLKGPDYAVLGLRAANGGTTEDERNAYVKAASHAILLCGRAVYKAAQEGTTGETRVDMREWEKWHDRFCAVAAGETDTKDCFISEETRELAKRAAGVMREIETPPKNEDIQGGNLTEDTASPESDGPETTQRSTVKPAVDSAEITDLVKRTATLMEQSETAHKKGNVEEGREAEDLASGETKKPQESSEDPAAQIGDNKQPADLINESIALSERPKSSDKKETMEQSDEAKKVTTTESKV